MQTVNDIDLNEVDARLEQFHRDLENALACDIALLMETTVSAIAREHGMQEDVVRCHARDYLVSLAVAQRVRAMNPDGVVADDDEFANVSVTESDIAQLCCNVHYLMLGTVRSINGE